MAAEKRIGRYRIDGELGRGGMGVVYRAHDLKLERPVAIKVLPDSLSQDREQLSRFEREARTLARFNHPNIAAIHGLGECENGDRFLVLELVEGKTLEQLLDGDGLSMETSVSVGVQVAAALSAAHKREIIHRDLKPDNVSINPEGIVKVLDFGLAKNRKESATNSSTPVEATSETIEWTESTTPVDVIKGTPGYMSPEQIRGQALDKRTDIFAYGCLLYECLSGEKAFHGHTIGDYVDATLNAQPDWTRLPAGLPDRIRRLLERCLEKDIEKRLPDLSEAVTELEEGIRGKSTPELAPNNLPTLLSSFVGRSRELQEMEELSARCRLVTLTGPGGSGKTRLSLRLAEQRLSAHPDGVWFVEFATVSNPEQVPAALLMTLGLREEPKRSSLAIAREFLKPSGTLLIFDNCEHLVEACAKLAEEILHGCPDVKLLASSREPLGIEGETIYQVPPLSISEDLESPLARDLEAFESIALFVERARAAKPGFRLKDENAPYVARICHRLNGIPLAIELAATRVRSLSPEQIFQRLEESFQILTRGSRTALPRQQTMRAAFDWSYQLLSEEEQNLLGHLSVFAGGWTLEAAEEVCEEDASEPDLEVLELLSSLVEKSLVIYEDTEDGQGRYRSLETTHQFAREELEKRGGGEGVRERHLLLFLALAEEAGPQLRGPEQSQWLDRLKRENENIKVALEACFSLPQGNESRLRFAVALWRFWLIHGDFTFGRSVLGETLRHYEAGSRAPLWAEAFHGAAALALTQGDYGEARSLFENSLGIYRELSDKQGIASVLGNLGLMAADQGDYQGARTLYTGSLEVFRELGDQRGVAIALGNLGIVASSQADYRAAGALYEESLSIHQQQGNKRGVAIALVSLGSVADDQGDPAAAQLLYKDALAIFRELGDRRSIATTLDNLGSVASTQGDISAARALHEESLGIYRALGDRRGLAGALVSLSSLALHTGNREEAVRWLEESLELIMELDEKQGGVRALEVAGELALQAGEYERSAQLYGAAEAIRRGIGVHRNERQGKLLAASTTDLRRHLGEERFARAWSTGGRFSFEEALRYAGAGISKRNP
ncbi:MAG: tetratricopeptide repeat protein [Planctomycetota bacterium]